MPEQVWKVQEPGLSGSAKLGILSLMLMCFGAGFWLGTSRPVDAEKAAANPVAPAPVAVPLPGLVPPSQPISTVSVRIPQPKEVPLEVLKPKTPPPTPATIAITQAPVVAAPVPPNPVRQIKLVVPVTPTPAPVAQVAAKVPPPVTDPKLPGFNFALASNGATATGGSSPNLMIDGNSTEFDGGTGFSSSNWTKNPPDAFLITLKEPSKLDCLRFLLWDKDPRYYRYKLEVCPDAEGKNWIMAADFSKGKDECRGWQLIRLTPQTVKHIRLTGTFNSANSAFHVVEFQASLGAPAGVHVPQEMEF